MSPDTAKKSFELDGKRQAVATEEFDYIQSQIESVSGSGLDRSTQVPDLTWGSHKDSWELTHDIEALSAEFGMEHGSTEREKIQGGF